MAIVAVFLAYLMMPGATELAEAAVHLVGHGDTAHGDAEGHGDSGPTDEHGCSGGYHLCVCHHSGGFVVPPSVWVVTREAAEHADLPPPATSQAGDFVGLIFRPPIA